MNKKGQFYLFTAVILIMTLFLGIANKSSVDLGRIRDINTLSENYVYEGTIIMNNAIYAEKNITESLANYTVEFISFADTKDIDLGILFLFHHNGTITIVNYLKEPVLISGDTVSRTEAYSQDFAETVSVDHKNVSYAFTFTYPYTELKSLLLENG